MAVYGLGVDLVRVERIGSVIERWGDRFLHRVFTESEQRDCAPRRRSASCLALRFAAKEAFMKALGRGLRPPVSWLDVEVTRGPMGRPDIRLSRRAESFCRSLGVRCWHLSLTDDGEYGAAVVVLEGSPGETTED